MFFERYASLRVQDLGLPGFSQWDILRKALLSRGFFLSGSKKFLIDLKKLERYFSSLSTALIPHEGRNASKYLPAAPPCGMG
jgi:hypothetical protein